MGKFYRYVDGKLVEVGSDEDRAEREKNAGVVVDPSIESEQYRLKSRDSYINYVWGKFNNLVEIEAIKGANLEKRAREYATFEQYYRTRMAAINNPGINRISNEAPQEEDWRETLHELHVGIAQSNERSVIYKLASQTLTEIIPSEKSDRLSDAIMVLARKHEALLQEHAARGSILWDLYARIEKEPGNAALLRDIYGTKYSDYASEELDLVRLAAAKDLLVDERAKRLNLFEAS
jgi:hypothetical protein